MSKEKQYPTTDGRFLTSREAKAKGLSLVTVELGKADMAKLRKKAKALGVPPGVALWQMVEQEQGEEDAAEKQLAELAAKWKGVTATQMFGTLWHKCEELSGMMEECRRRLWKETSKGEGNARLNDALDQSARCFADQLNAIATFARHAWIWRRLPQDSYDVQDWMRTDEGQKAFEAAEKKYGTPLTILKTTDGKFEFAPATGTRA